MKKNDKYVLIGIIVLIALVSALIYIPKLISKEAGSTAIISRGGIEIERVDLSLVESPYEFTIQTDSGGYNTIYVDKNKIRFIDANCPDKVCIEAGFLSYSKDIAVCLPHGLFIEIESGKEREIDALLY